MSDHLHLNRKMRFDDWVKQSAVTSEESKAVKDRVKPIEQHSTGDLFQETSLDRELEIVREQNHFGDDLGVGRSEAERISLTTARQLREMKEQFEKQEERREKQDGQLTHIASELTAINSRLANNLPNGPVPDYMTTEEFGNALGCGSANVLKMLKEETIPDSLLLPGTGQKGRERKFRRNETQIWLSKYLKTKKPRSRSSATSRRTTPKGRKSGK